MFKRFFWLMVGTMLGFGSSLWITRTVKRTLHRLSPPQVSGSVVRSVKRTAGDLRAALADGREAMHQREASLRAEVSARSTGARSNGARSTGAPSIGARSIGARSNGARLANPA